MIYAFVIVLTLNIKTIKGKHYE
ncbi:hypothetical protein KPHVMX_530005 [Klebsiella pneumoniae]|nr:hypothetical protein KPHVMX_530005 [Klebsiella pneumoniae]